MHYNITQTDGIYRVSESHRVLAHHNRPRSRCVALTDCIVTKSDGTQYVIPRSARSRKSRANVVQRVTQYAPTHRINAADLAPVQDYTNDN